MKRVEENSPNRSSVHVPVPVHIGSVKLNSGSRNLTASKNKLDAVSANIRSFCNVCRCESQPNQLNVKREKR